MKSCVCGTFENCKSAVEFKESFIKKKKSINLKEWYWEQIVAELKLQNEMTFSYPCNIWK